MKISQNLLSKNIATILTFTCLSHGTSNAKTVNFYGAFAAGIDRGNYDFNVQDLSPTKTPFKFNSTSACLQLEGGVSVDLANDYFVDLGVGFGFSNQKASKKVGDYKYGKVGYIGNPGALPTPVNGIIELPTRLSLEKGFDITPKIKLGIIMDNYKPFISFGLNWSRYTLDYETKDVDFTKTNFSTKKRIVSFVPGIGFEKKLNNNLFLTLNAEYKFGKNIHMEKSGIDSSGKPDGKAIINGKSNHFKLLYGLKAYL